MYVDAAGRWASSGKASDSQGSQRFQNAAASDMWLQYSGSLQHKDHWRKS
jgi:hypothetical protein